MANLRNLFLFQVSWFALVLSVPAGAAAVGVAVSLAILAVHLGWFSLPREWLFIVAIGLGGWLWESLIHVLDIVDHGSRTDFSMMAPPWMALLWMNFAMTLNHSLAWLKGQWFYAALLGATGGPVAFWSGARLGAIGFGDEVVAMVALSFSWAVLSPLAVRLAMALDSRPPPTREGPSWN